MAYLVELPVTVNGESAEVVKVQIAESADGLVKAARPGQVVARATRSLGEMLAGIRPVAEDFVSNFREMVDAPDEIGVEFGISLSAEADVVITSTAAEAAFSVSLKWRPAASDSGDPAALSS
ncbi:CU044_2847 family protein [Actinoallomurus sp. NPDC050550]|uniref:CU044_2847 family protein n=1 Tax=Actinoallomurus sp. NPDC050550 TaxID=3154937 RepID=UPI0033DC4E11